MPKYPELLTNLAFIKHRETPSDVMAHRLVGVLQEVSDLEPEAAKKKLLYHQFRAQVKEQINLPFHSYAMALRVDGKREPQLELHDDLYQNSNVLDRCQRAIGIAKDAVEAARFAKEKQQIVQLLELLHQDIPGMEPAILASLAQENSTLELATTPETAEAVTATLTTLGWQATDQLITPEVSWQFDVPDNAMCIAGPKYFYVMPKSPIHQGWKTMYLIAQPVYIPGTNQWLVLQNQHLAEASWKDYDQLLSRLTGQKLPPHWFESRTAKEARVMSECLALDPQYQTQPAETVFIELLYRQFGKNRQAKKIWTQQQRLLQTYDHLEQTFDLHTSYLLEILRLENGWEPDWTPAKTERLFQAYFKTFSSFYHQQPISAEHIQAWIQNHYDMYQNPTIRQTPKAYREKHRLLSANISPWLLLAIESQLECSLLAAPSLLLTTALNPTLLSAINSNNFTFAQLEQVIGADRAKRWKLGTCIACHEHNVWIGDKLSGKECDVCLKCEMKDNGVSFDTPLAANTPTDTSAISPPPTEILHLKKTVSVTEMLAGDWGPSITVPQTAA